VATRDEKNEDMFSRFDRIPACDRQTDRQTDGRTDILRSIASHGRKRLCLALLYITSKRDRSRFQERRQTTFKKLYFSPLECKGNYSVTSNNMKLGHWPLMGGL